MSTSNTNNLPKTTNGENAAPAVSARNSKPVTRRYGTRNASRRALADIGNRASTTSTTNNKLRNTKPKASGLAESNKLATNKTTNANYSDSIATRTRGKRRRAAGAVDENTRNTPRQRLERTIRAPEEVTPKAIREPTEEEKAYAESLVLPEGVIDIDTSDSGNHLAESTMAIPVMRSMVTLEQTSCAAAGYMFIQGEVTAHHRRILVDWLVDVHSQFRMTPPTLYLTVNIVDRFLSQKAVAKRTLQLVGVGCMLVASKYEEIYPPSMEDFVYIADGSFSREELIRMEALIVNVLEFRVTVATPLPFVTRTLKAAAAHDADPRVALVAHYALELALCDYNSLHFRPSHLSAAAVLLATRGAVQWDDTMRFHSGGYTAEALAECVDHLRKLVAEDAGAMSTRLNAVRRKYSKEKHGQIALVADELKSEMEMEMEDHRF